MRLQNIKPIEESLFPVNLKLAAHNWIDSHPDIMSSIAHHHDDGDEKAIEQVLQQQIQNEKLFVAVMDTLFSGYSKHCN